MYKLRIKLISPPQLETLKGYNYWQTQRYNYYFMPSYGLAVITGTLRENGYYVCQEDLAFMNKKLSDKFSLYLYDYWDVMPKILQTGRDDCIVNMIIDEVFRTISFNGFNLIGFSILSFGHFLFAVMLARKIRDISNVPIIFGGAFITIFGHLYPEIFNYVDYMIVGDGREPFVKLLDYLQYRRMDIEDVPNVVYKKGKRLISTRFVNYPLEDIPLPDFTGLTLESYRNPLNREIVLPYQITRGCVYRCNFCVQSPIENTFQTKTYGKVIKELREMRKRYNCYTFYFCDSNISISYKYLENLLDCFIYENIGLTWRCYMDVKAMNADIIAKIRKAGCDALMYGIETGSDRILRMIGKNQTTKQAEQVLKWAKKADIDVTAFFMTGFPYEEQKDVIDTINFISNNKEYIDFGVVRKFTVIYGTFLYQYPLQYKVCNLKPQNSRYMFDFDEIYGVQWQEKALRQEKAKQKIERVLIDNIF